MKKIDYNLLHKLTQEQEDILKSHTSTSATTYQTAKQCLIGGVGSGYHSRVPYPLYISRGSGSKIYDVDGTEYSDFHLCFGALAAGHANPHITKSITQCLTTGILTGAPGKDNIQVASILSKLFHSSLSHWRFTNSGTEATRDAIQIARGITGHDHIIKIECGWHGMHESVCVSYHPPVEEAGPITSPFSVPSHIGIPKSVTTLTLVIPFNCPRSVLEDKIKSVNGKVACLIVEPVMMNCGIILPETGFLQMLRDVCSANKILLIFDEVKTNSTVHVGGATSLFGVVPDLITIGKSFGGGAPIGAVGMNESLASHVAEGEPPTCGTYNGNPLSMASAHAFLENVLTTENFESVSALNLSLKTQLEGIINEFNLPAQVTIIGSKGCVSFTTQKITDYRVYRTQCCHELNDLMWYYMINNGVWMAPGGDEEWTISMQHTTEDISRVVNAFKKFAQACVAALQKG